jgi:hypothetical protein
MIAKNGKIALPDFKTLSPMMVDREGDSSSVKAVLSFFITNQGEGPASDDISVSLYSKTEGRTLAGGMMPTKGLDAGAGVLVKLEVDRDELRESDIEFQTNVGSGSLRECVTENNRVDLDLKFEP